MGPLWLIWSYISQWLCLLTVPQTLPRIPRYSHRQTLALDFTQMLKDRNSQHLNVWIEQAKASNIPELVNFVNALCRDLAAVAVALTLDISNGQVEGQVNRLKLIKRSGYGRASFQLLKRRFSLPNQ